MNDQNTSEIQPTSTDRRSLLRKGGAVVAGLAGLAVSETVMAGSANAAQGDPLVLGNTSNDAGSAETALSSAASTSTLRLANSAGFAPLNLEEQDTQIPANLTSGDLANYAGFLYYGTGSPNGSFTSFVYTEVTANQLVTIIPQRVLDSRFPSTRVHILNPSGNLDSTGRLLGGHQIEIDLSGLEFAAAGAFCNFTAVVPLSAGYMTLWQGGTRPATSSINFAANAVIANFAVTGVSGTDSVFIFANVTTHVILDVTAFAVGSRAQINPSILPATAAASSSQRLAARVKAGTVPRWYSPRE
jgi:hypothetical protein